MAAGVIALLLLVTRGAVGLRDIILSVPDAVSLGATTTLGCRWLLDEGETLYAVKWYRGALEFYRYVPKELPHTRVFPQPGIDVDVSRSGGEQVTLREAGRALGGRYRCEVSADAPYFHTVHKTAFMHIVELPESSPVIVAQKSWYTAGNILKANCTSPAAAPPANLTWLINGNEVKGFPLPPEQPVSKTNYSASLEDINSIIFSPWNTLPGYEEPVTDNVVDIPSVITYNSSRNWTLKTNVRVKNDLNPGATTLLKLSSVAELKPEEKQSKKRTDRTIDKIALDTNATEIEDKSNKSSSGSQLVLRVQNQHFKKGRLNLTCVAKIYSIYSAKAELIVEEERPQIAPVMGSRDSSTGYRSGGDGALCGVGVALTVLLSFRTLSPRQCGDVV